MGMPAGVVVVYLSQLYYYPNGNHSLLFVLRRKLALTKMGLFNANSLNFLVSAL